MLAGLEVRGEGGAAVFFGIQRLGSHDWVRGMRLTAQGIYVHDEVTSFLKCW